MKNIEKHIQSPELKALVSRVLFLQIFYDLA